VTKYFNPELYVEMGNKLDWMGTYTQEKPFFKGTSINSILSAKRNNVDFYEKKFISLDDISFANLAKELGYY